MMAISPPWRAAGRLRSGVLIAGAASYEALVGGAGVTFTSTPLLVGATAVAAGLIGRRRRRAMLGRQD